MKRYIQIGDVTIGKGHKYIFEELTNIGGGDVRRNEITFVNSDGSKLDEVYFNSRHFEIKGHILAETTDELHGLKQTLIHACYPKEDTTVVYYDGVNKYRAKARAESLPEFGKILSRSCRYVSFVASFVISSFYWTDYNITNIPISSRTNEIEASFILPCVFTSRVSQAEIYNPNAFDILPIIKVFGSSNSENGKIDIINKTTGESIILEDFTINANDIIVIDCENMTATLNGSENIINSFNDFEDFKIIKGKNIIKCLNNNSVSGLNVTIEYYRRWMGV